MPFTQSLLGRPRRIYLFIIYLLIIPSDWFLHFCCLVPVSCFICGLLVLMASLLKRDKQEWLHTWVCSSSSWLTRTCFQLQPLGLPAVQCSWPPPFCEECCHLPLWAVMALSGGWLPLTLKHGVILVVGWSWPCFPSTGGSGKWGLHLRETQTKEFAANFLIISSQEKDLDI